jgi:hypothetical protein
MSLTELEGFINIREDCHLCIRTALRKTLDPNSQYIEVNHLLTGRKVYTIKVVFTVQGRDAISKIEAFVALVKKWDTTSVVQLNAKTYFSC